MKTIFLDSSAQIALLSDKDANHTTATAILEQLDRERAALVMTDYVFDELLTALTTRVGRFKAIQYSQKFPGGKVMLVFIEPTDFYRAKRMFEQYTDKRWSFTDCVSFAVMQRMKITDAFSFDRDFTQAGFNLLK